MTNAKMLEAILARLVALEGTPAPAPKARKTAAKKALKAAIAGVKPSLVVDDTRKHTGLCAATNGRRVFVQDAQGNTFHFSASTFDSYLARAEDAAKIAAYKAITS
jgi:hypothetical protein